MADSSSPDVSGSRRTRLISSRIPSIALSTCSGDVAVYAQKTPGSIPAVAHVSLSTT